MHYVRDKTINYVGLGNILPIHDLMNSYKMYVTIIWVRLGNDFPDKQSY
jgi:hypothetical protein